MWYRYVSAWALDTAGLAPARWQPCRLLLPALRFPVRFMPRVMGPRMVKKLMRLRAHSTSAAPQAVRDTALDLLGLDLG